MHIKRRRTAARKHNGTGRTSKQTVTRSTDLDWLTPEQTRRLEKKLVDRGMHIYGLDEVAAREWARIFCRGEEDSVKSGQSAA